MRGKRNLGLWVVLVAMGVYLALFFAARLPSLELETGEVFRRGMFFIYLLLPDEHLAGWFGEPAELSLLDRLPVLAIAAGVLAWGFSAGWLAMAGIGASRGLRRLEVFVFSTAVGLNLISTYVLLVGLVGLLGNVLVFVVPAVLTLAAAAWRLVRGMPGATRLPLPMHEQGRTTRPCHRTNCPERTPCSISPRWLWLAAPFALAILLGSMLPPIEFDVREYHLQVPKEFFLAGRIGFLPHNVYGNMAMASEMLCLLAMVIADDWWLGALAGKTVIGAFAALTALGLLAAGRRFLSPAAGVVAAVVYISTPWVAQVSSLGLVEGAAACYLFLAVYGVLLWRASSACAGGESGLARLVVAGYLAGGAVATKYPAVLFAFAPLLVWVVLAAWFKGDRRGLGARKLAGEGDSPIFAARKLGQSPVWKPVGVFVLAAAVGCGLWFGKNWVLTGNPTYPLLYEVFDSPHWSPEKDQQWSRAHRPHDFSPRAAVDAAGRVVLGSEWLGPLLMPLAGVALLGVVLRFWFPSSSLGTGSVGRGRSVDRGSQAGAWEPANGVRGAKGTKGTVPFSLRENWDSPQGRLVIGLTVYVVYVVVAWWLLTHRIDRFWIPVLPLVALLAGQGACWSRGRAWRLTLTALLVLTSLFNFLVVTSVAGGYNRYFVGLERLRDDPNRIDPWHRYFNEQAARGRVLLVGDAQPFDFEVPVAYNTVFDDSVFEQLAAGRSAEEVRQALVDQGITHVYVHWGEIARYRSSGNYGFTEFVEPEVFDGLVDAGVLRPLPAVEDHPGRAYEVVCESGR